MNFKGCMKTEAKMSHIIEHSPDKSWPFCWAGSSINFLSFSFGFGSLSTFWIMASGSNSVSSSGTMSFVAERLQSRSDELEMTLSEWSMVLDTSTEVVRLILMELPADWDGATNEETTPGRAFSSRDLSRLTFSTGSCFTENKHAWIVCLINK